jgi:hypothetical protein
MKKIILFIYFSLALLDLFAQNAGRLMLKDEKN